MAHGNFVPYQFPFSNPLHPCSDQHKISLYRSIAESVIKVMRIKEMIANLGSFDLLMNSPCQCQRKSIEKSVENIDTEVRM